MERLRTRIWRGGMEEILSGANKASLPNSSPFEVTRILSADEAGELQRAVRSQLQAQLAGPSARPDNEPAGDAQVRHLAQELGLGPRRKRRAGLALVALCICVGGWFAQRAAATSRVKTARPAPVTQVAPIPTPTVEPLMHPAHEASHTDAPRFSRARPRKLPRVAVDALAAGDASGAAALYGQLAAETDGPTPFAAAAEILRARAEHQGARSPRR